MKPWFGAMIGTSDQPYWPAEACKLFLLLQDAGFNMAFKPIRVKFKPSAKDVQTCEESGVDLAQAVHRVMRVQERQAGNSQVKTGIPRLIKTLHEHATVSDASAMPPCPPPPPLPCWWTSCISMQQHREAIVLPSPAPPPL